MLLNPDSSKPAQEVLFSRKKKVQSHPILTLKIVQVEKSSYQKTSWPSTWWKAKLQHIDNAISKINKGIAVIKKLRYSLPRKSQITIYKAFLRPLIDYGDIICDQPQNDAFCEKLESVQYRASLAITAAIQGSSRYKIYKELRFRNIKIKKMV